MKQETKHSIKIAVIGPHQCSEEYYQQGFEVGQHIAQAGAILVCGGGSGMMEAAAKGAKSAGGTTVGILPGSHTGEANPFIDVALPTGLGHFRNVLVPRSADAVIAVHGAYGTLSELAFALLQGIPIVGLHTWQLMRDGEKDRGVVEVETPEEAVRKAIELSVG